MSGLLGTAAFGAAVISDILLKTPRSIGIIIPDCTIEEVLRDELEITSHPIEYGTPITDHSYKLQREVTARYGWDNSIVPSISSLVGAVSGGALPSFSFTKVLDVYNALLTLQASRQPFILITGKMTYPSMLIASLTCTTDAASEHALMVTALFREVIIVKTQSAQATPLSAQAAPQKTAAPTSTGTSTTGAPPSAAPPLPALNNVPGPPPLPPVLGTPPT